MSVIVSGLVSGPGYLWPVLSQAVPGHQAWSCGHGPCWATTRSGWDILWPGNTALTVMIRGTVATMMQCKMAASAPPSG